MVSTSYQIVISIRINFTIHLFVLSVDTNVVYTTAIDGWQVTTAIVSWSDFVTMLKLMILRIIICHKLTWTF